MATLIVVWCCIAVVPGVGQSVFITMSSLEGSISTAAEVKVPQDLGIVSTRTREDVLTTLWRKE